MGMKEWWSGGGGMVEWGWWDGGVGVVGWWSGGGGMVEWAWRNGEVEATKCLGWIRKLENLKKSLSGVVLKVI